MAGHVTVSIEVSDGITQTIKSLTYYDEKGDPAKLTDVLFALMEDNYPEVLEALTLPLK